MKSQTIFFVGFVIALNGFRKYIRTQKNIIWNIKKSSIVSVASVMLRQKVINIMTKQKNIQKNIFKGV